MSEYIIKQIAAASVPNAPAGAFTLFLDTDGNWKKKDENGVVSLVAGVADKNLQQVLTVGNSTGSNDIIVQDNKVIKSSTGNTVITFNANSMTINAGSFATDIAVANLTMSSLGNSMALFKSDFSKIGFFQVIENSTGNQTTGTLPNYPVVSGSQNSTINQNVINTSINGGNNIIAKTNNTDYSNQNGYNTGTAGELIVNHTPSTTDRTQTHQDADGTIALTSDLPVDTTKSVQGDGVLTNIELVNDSLTPGNDKYYGTDSSGAKGFHSMSSNGDMTKAVYDPTNINASAFDYANFLGVNQIKGSSLTFNMDSDKNNVDWDGYNIINLTTSSQDRVITGIKAPASGVNRIIYVMNNSSSFRIKLQGNSGSSTTNNRIVLRQNSSSRNLLQYQLCVIIYNHVLNKWFVNRIA